MNRRALLALLLVVAVLLILFLLLGRGGGSPAAVATPSPSIVVAAPTATLPPSVSLDVAEARSYAAALVPFVDHGLTIFNATAAAAATSHTLAQLNHVCVSRGQPIVVNDGQVEGVPHPYPWYTPAGTLHHRLIGIYHTMMGATVACQTDTGNHLSEAASRAVSLMARSARRLQRIDITLHKMAARPH